ncbi:kinase-like protein [Westerdykella ornata]|uniref:non-specific serine/threonine protein kinase n=1 Tax=Westerdykella ornata TaxID=318751 RepID=A0A6A6JIN2_WESOR|nr:kinase-like protein [Westerdykella ornata]KAF2276510.1 kinase-like protein [Westerdykella ornata]
MSGRADTAELILEYCPWRSLSYVARLTYSSGQFCIVHNETCLLSIFVQLSAALAFLHEGMGRPTDWNRKPPGNGHWRCMVHRAIHPSNILVKHLGDRADRGDILVKLGDFGNAAFFLENPNLQPEALGYPICWPPEMRNPAYIWTSAPYGPPADIWAIGAVIHQLVHGKYPIESVPDIIRRLDQNGPMSRYWHIVGLLGRSGGVIFTARSLRKG